MSWWTTLPEFVITFVLIFGPGCALGYSVGARGLAVACLSPLMSVAIVGVAGIASGLVGISWSIIPVIFTTLGAVLAGWALRRFAFRTSTPNSELTSFRVWAGAILGLVLGAAFIGRRLLQVIGSPENFAQRFDNVFHLNAIRYIIESGNASSLTLGTMTGAEGAGAIYPSAWHSTAALIAQVSGSDVVVAENVLNIVIGAVIWPVGLIFLVYQILGPRPFALAAAGGLSAGFAAFPISIMDFGPLYPNILAYALLPAALAIVIELCRLSYRPTTNKFCLWMLLAVAIPGLALSQTNGLLSLIAFSMPLGLWVAAREIWKVRTNPEQRYRVAGLVFWTLFGLVVFILIWRFLRPLGDYDGWSPFTTQAGAIGEAVTNAPIGRAVTWAASILALIGIQRVVNSRDRSWVFLCWLVPVVLYVTTASAPKGAMRMLMTGGWYQDSYRLAALLPIFATVLAAIGSLYLWDLVKAPITAGLNRVARMVSSKVPKVSTVGPAVVFLLAVVAASQYGTMGPITQEAAKAYVMDSKAPIVDSEELALIRRLSTTVPADAVIAVNPWNGGSLAYALTGRKVTMYHMFSAEDPEKRIIEETLGSALPGSAACEIAQRRNVAYILDFGGTFLANSAAAEDFPGLVDVKPSASVEVVDSQGQAQLLRVSC